MVSEGWSWVGRDGAVGCCVEEAAGGCWGGTAGRCGAAVVWAAGAGVAVEGAGVELVGGTGVVWARRGAAAITRESRKRQALWATARSGLSKGITLDSLLN